MYQVINPDLSKQQFATHVELWKSLEKIPVNDVGKLRLRRIQRNGRWSRKYNIVDAVQNGVVQTLLDVETKALVN
jgi:hypothetical protein